MANYTVVDVLEVANAVCVISLRAGTANQHWSPNSIANQEGSKIYIAVGSGTNIAEKGIENELLRATILRCKPDASELEVLASALRNPDDDKVYGGPVAAIVMKNGSLSVTDDKTHTIWRVGFEE